MFRKKVKKESYNKEEQKPMIKSSICTGEKVAGFKNIRTGKFTEVYDHIAAGECAEMEKVLVGIGNGFNECMR